MTIVVLKSERHTYRHTQSLFSTFFFGQSSNHNEGTPETKAPAMGSGDWDGFAARKLLDMGQDGFQIILEEFPREMHSLKPLAEALRQVLFLVRAGVSTSRRKS